MKLGIILFIVGSTLILYLANIKFRKNFLSKVGIIFGILLVVYGLILSIQPKEYIVYTKTTISQDSK